MVYNGTSRYFQPNFELLLLCFFFTWAFCLCSFFMRFPTKLLSIFSTNLLYKMYASISFARSECSVCFLNSVFWKKWVWNLLNFNLKTTTATHLKFLQNGPTTTIFFHKKGIVSIWRNNYATCQSKEDVEGAVNVLTPNMWDSVKSDQGQSVKHI